MEKLEFLRMEMNVYCSAGDSNAKLLLNQHFLLHLSPFGVLRGLGAVR